MRERRGLERSRDLCSGPGKLTQALGIELDLNGGSLATGPVRILPARADWAAAQVVTGPRVGINHAAELPWRFAVVGDPNVSRPRPPAALTTPSGTSPPAERSTPAPGAARAVKVAIRRGAVEHGQPGGVEGGLPALRPPRHGAWRQGALAPPASAPPAGRSSVEPAGRAPASAWGCSVLRGRGREWGSLRASPACVRSARWGGRGGVGAAVGGAGALARPDPDPWVLDGCEPSGAGGFLRGGAAVLGVRFAFGVDPQGGGHEVVPDEGGEGAAEDRAALRSRWSSGPAFRGSRPTRRRCTWSPTRRTRRRRSWRWCRSCRRRTGRSRRPCRSRTGARFRASRSPSARPRRGGSAWS